MQIPHDLVDRFAALDHVRLTRMTDRERAAHLEARQLLQDYVEALWADVGRAGERPDVGDKYQALAVMRELTRSLTTVAFDAVYDRPPR